MKYKVWIAAALALVVGYLVVFQWILPTYRPPLVGSWKRQGLEITFGVGGTGTATTRPYEPRVSQVRTKYGEPESGINPLEIAGIGSGPIDFNWKRQGNLLWVRPIQRSDWPDPVRWIVSEDGQQLSLYSDSGVFTLYRFE